MSPLDLLTICISVASLIFSIPAFILSLKKNRREKIDLSVETFPIPLKDTHKMLRVDFSFYNRSEIGTTILYIKLLKYNEYAYTPSIGTVRDVFIDSHQRKSFTSYFYNTEVDELSFLIKLNIGKVKIRQKVQ